MSGRFDHRQSGHGAGALSLVLLLGLWGAGTAGAAPFAYVPNTTPGNVSVIDRATNTVVATVTVGASPRGVVVTPAGTRVYVTNGGGSNVSVIDTATNTVVATVTARANPSAFGIFIAQGLGAVPTLSEWR